MSRGLGKMQLLMLGVIDHHGKPLTFAEICAELAKLRGWSSDIEFRPSALRSMRRALHRMATTGELIALGDGRPGNPYRYFFHPVFIIAEMGDEAQALQKALDADPGAEEAYARDRARFMAKFKAALAALPEIPPPGGG